MSEVKVTCPCCGNIVYLIVNEDGSFELRPFDYMDSDTTELLRQASELCGYEFGTDVAAEGGEKDE